MAESSYDCIVIGSGPGGYVAAIRAAQLGKRTAVVERDKVGGRCLNYACIPAKAVLRSADLLTEIRDAGEFGLNVAGVEVDYAAVQARRDKVVGTLTSGVGGLFKKNGIDLIEGDATLTADGDVRVGDEAIAAGSVILATGSVPLPIGGIELGGRIIGTEEAWALLEALDGVLPSEDADISRLVERGLKRQNIEVVTNAKLSAAEDSGSSVKLT